MPGPSYGTEHEKAQLLSWGIWENGSTVASLRPLGRLHETQTDEDRDDDNTTHAEPLATAALPRQVRDLHGRRLRSSILFARQQPPPPAGPGARDLVDDLVAANRILAQEGVVDAYGHVSARHTRATNRFLLSRSVAPELVTAADVMEYDLEGNAVSPAGRSSYLERFIHSEIYKARSDVNAIVHCHTPSIIPFGASTYGFSRSTS